MGTNSQQGFTPRYRGRNCWRGPGRWFLTPLLGISTINQSNFSLPALVVSLLGAIILLAIVKFFRRRGVFAR